MLYIIGLGISDENDMPIKCLEILENCDAIYCELFTSKWLGDIEKVADMAGKEIEILTREQVEQKFPLESALNKDIVLLVPGDPLTATTHFQLMLEAKKLNVKAEVIHASSIYTAVAETGLQLYKFGRATTLPFPDVQKPTSPFDVIQNNKKSGLHTLVLLDADRENDRCMTALAALKILNENGFSNEKVVACCKLGSKDSIIKYGTVSAFVNSSELDKAPAVIIILGEINFKEEEAMELWK